MPIKSLSIVIPCLNEAETIAGCIANAHAFLATLPVPGEVIVADNGSTDDSVIIAGNSHAKVVRVASRGYGAALHTGILQASGSHVLFADADQSYHFTDAALLIDCLNNGVDMVIGNRYKGGIQPNAMPFLHRYLGTPVISFLGRKSFKIKLYDFNCGMRGLDRVKYTGLGMTSTGMEYATELIARAAYRKWRIAEVPVPLYKDQRLRKPHLKTWQDGWRHLKLILLLAPQWILLFPALFFLVTGTVLGGVLSVSYMKVSRFVLDIHTLYFCSVFLLTGVQLLQFYTVSRIYGQSMGLYPLGTMLKKVTAFFRFGRGILYGLLLLLAGIGLAGFAFIMWQRQHFGNMDPRRLFRVVIPSGFFITLGMQLIIFSFMLGFVQQLATKNTDIEQ